jgi:hypothetical protein
MPKVSAGQGGVVGLSHEIGSGNSFEEQQMARLGGVQTCDKAVHDARRSLRAKDKVCPTAVGPHRAIRRRHRLERTNDRRAYCHDPSADLPRIRHKTGGRFGDVVALGCWRFVELRT